MKNKKLQVFVSSTFEDLKEERQAAVEAILSAGHIPAGMELFTAGNETQMAVIKRWIDDSDVYLLILGGRYGSVDKTSDKSYTQLEYEYAVEKGKALFAVVISDTGLDAKVTKSGRSVLEQKFQNELTLFRDEVLTKLVKFWDDKNHIENAIYKTLNEFSYREELVGWVRGDNAVTGVVAEELARLGKENEEMKSRLSRSADSPLYAGLTYDQLKELLIKETNEVDGRRISLFELILEYGRIFSQGYKEGLGVRISDSLINKLMIYKIIFRITGLVAMHYQFTDVGHNFYLKSLALRNEENNS